ncbi:MAG TPA: hypothetical protein VFU95_11350 [Telluria sp.]|nr:hypothetical protein [Telluria sp.]
MKTSLPNVSFNGRVSREVERERHEKEMVDEARVGLAPGDEFRSKDARENASSGNLKRSPAR